MGHTPGPWEAKDWMVSNHPTIPLKVVCYTAHNAATRTDENLCNARLIAAAPELLDALNDLLEVVTQDQLIPESVSYMRQARAAIAKATSPSPQA